MGCTNWVIESDAVMSSMHLEDRIREHLKLLLSRISENLYPKLIEELFVIFPDKRIL